MAKKVEKILSVPEIKAAVEEENLGWVPGETTLTALPIEEKDKYLGVDSPPGQS